MADFECLGINLDMQGGVKLRHLVLLSDRELAKSAVSDRRNAKLVKLPCYGK